MLSHRLITTGFFSLALTAIAVFGSVHGNAMQAQALENLAVQERVTTFATASATTAQAYEAAQARLALEGFQPTIDTASALVASSADKASQESRNKLQAILDEFKIKTDVHTATGSDFREVVSQSIATATPKIASASQVVTDEVTAWQAAEDARIEAERVAAEEAARASYGGGSGYSGGYSESGSSGGYSGGGSFRDWIESEAAAWGVSVAYIDGNISYGSVNHIRVANVVADAGGERARMVVRHEIAHAVSYRSGNCMSAGLNTEVTAQYFTMRTWGFYVDNYRAPTAEENEALRAVCG